jgi:hypothetical protein
VAEEVVAKAATGGRRVATAAEMRALAAFVAPLIDADRPDDDVVRPALISFTPLTTP